MAGAIINLVTIFAKLSLDFSAIVIVKPLNNLFTNPSLGQQAASANPVTTFTKSDPSKQTLLPPPTHFKRDDRIFETDKN